jgi:hypothetical protein
MKKIRLLCLLVLLGMIVGCSKSPAGPSTDPTATPVPGGGNLATATPNRTATANATLTPGGGGSPTATPVITSYTVAYDVTCSGLGFYYAYNDGTISHPGVGTSIWGVTVGMHTGQYALLTVGNNSALTENITATIKVNGITVCTSSHVLAPGTFLPSPELEYLLH